MQHEKLCKQIFKLHCCHFYLNNKVIYYQNNMVANNNFRKLKPKETTLQTWFHTSRWHSILNILITCSALEAFRQACVFGCMSQGHRSVTLQETFTSHLLQQPRAPEPPTTASLLFSRWHQVTAWSFTFPALLTLFPYCISPSVISCQSSKPWL